MRNLVFSLPLAAALAACSSTPEPDARQTPVGVSVTWRERIMLPADHLMSVRVEDVSLADAPARVLAEVRRPLGDRAPPYAVTVEVPTEAIDPRHTYAVRAEIREPGGALRFTTDIRHVVLTQGARNRADIVLVAAR